MKNQMMMAFLVLTSMLGAAQTVNAANEIKNPVINKLKSIKDSVPLYVVDGKKITAAEMKNLKPADIESITVLKDQKAIEAYGVEGKNGVILIVTKAAKKAKETNE